jgi:hypothetical protein
MRKQMTKVRLVLLAAVVAGFATMGFASSASAHTGAFAAFNYCPSKTTGVVKCVQSVTKGGKVILGKKTVPIVNPVTLQGGVGKSEFQENEEITEKFFAATNGGETLSKSPQPVPGGLTGLVNCKEISLFFLRISCESIFENGLTGVASTVELARPASEIVVSEENLGGELSLPALKMPVKVHLENPLLGSECYIGSSSTPIWWNLTTGTTSPPPPNTPLKGTVGKLTISEGIATFTGANLVDNAWAAPAATGCGGFLVEYVLDPIINASVGVPSAAGKNTTALESTTIKLANAALVNEH